MEINHACLLKDKEALFPLTCLFKILVLRNLVRGIKTSFFVLHFKVQS